MKKFKSENNSDNNNSDSRRVYVANVPFDVKWSELKDLFREKVGDVTYCTIFENEDGKSRGCGLLEFADSQTARKAIEIMHRSEFKSRELVVKEDLDCERDRYGRIITNHGNNRSRDDSQRRDGSNNDRGNNRDRGNRQQQQQQQQNNSNNYGYDHSVMSNVFAPPQQHNTFGLSQQFLDSLGIGLPLNNRIFVANLEYKVDQKKLEEIFKLAGKVSRVKLSHDAQGQSRGYGTVEYEHPVEAVQAISMFNNQKLYGRTMSVRMDKYECEDDVESLPSKLPVGLESIGKGLGAGGQPLNVAKSIMNATVIAPPHLATPGQPIPHQMHPQTVQQPAAMQQAVIAAQMQQLQQQQHAGAMPQTIQQALPPTMQHQLQQSLQPPMQQQYQIHQLAQPQQQALAQAGVQPMSNVTYQALQQLQANAVRAPQATNVYQQPQQPTQQGPPPTQQPTAQVQQPQQPQQQPSSTPATNLSVYSTFERQFREASAPQGFK